MGLNRFFAMRASFFKQRNVFDRQGLETLDNMSILHSAGRRPRGRMNGRIGPSSNEVPIGDIGAAAHPERCQESDDNAFYESNTDW